MGNHKSSLLSALVLFAGVAVLWCGFLVAEKHPEFAAPSYVLGFIVYAAAVAACVSIAKKGRRDTENK